MDGALKGGAACGRRKMQAICPRLITQHSAPPTYYNGGPPMPPPMKRPPMPPQPPPKVFFAPQKYGFFTANNVEQRWRDDPDKEKKSQADDIIANVTEKFFPGAKRAAEQGPHRFPLFMPAARALNILEPLICYSRRVGSDNISTKFLIRNGVEDAKRIKFNDEDSDENELFAKLLYKKLKSIASRKRLEILHVSIMEMVRQAQEEDERERGVLCSVISSMKVLSQSKLFCLIKSKKGSGGLLQRPMTAIDEMKEYDTREAILQRVRALGFNAIQYYIPWNFHEIYEGKYNFSGMRNFTEFSRIAYELGMYSLVRVGPYVCGEWENGGLPWWLLNKNITDMRTSESGFKKAVDKWYSVLLPLIKPLMRHNGGPVLMLQVENEYGSYKACDRDYTKWLRDRIWYYVGKESVLYTTTIRMQITGYLQLMVTIWRISNVVLFRYTLTTVDFGPTSNENINNSFHSATKIPSERSWSSGKFGILSGMAGAMGPNEGHHSLSRRYCKVSKM
ncbi:glycosyl hydrolase family 35 [Cooperia oncophora]